MNAGLRADEGNDKQDIHLLSFSMERQLQHIREKKVIILCYDSIPRLQNNMNEYSTYFNTDDDNDDTQLNLFPPFSTVSHPFDLAEKEEMEQRLYAIA